MQNFREIIGESQGIREALKIVKKVAKTDATILITGETGTGKALMAEAIHKNSQKAKNPYIQFNCATIQETLLESEIFGHEKGAFTGAYKVHLGKVERAKGGTLFLDEIGDMTLALQTKLLWVLENEGFERVGGEKVIAADVRIIAASNKNLEEEIKRRNFREDLYYRLNQVRIHLSPLRERPEDIPLLIEYFLDRFSQEYNRAVELSKRERGWLLKHSWPGNVRQLENTIKSFVLGVKNNLINDLVKERKGEKEMEETREEKPDKTSEILAQALSQTLSASQKQLETLLNILAQGKNDEVRQLKEEVAWLEKDLEKVKSRLGKEPILQKEGKQRKGKSRYPGYQELLDAVKKAKGNKAKAAQMFGCHQATMYNWHKRALKEKKEAETKE